MTKTLKNALLVFIGGCCYGGVIPLVRTGQSNGYNPAELMVVQYIISVVIMLVVFFIIRDFSIRPKQMLQLAGTGIVGAGVSFFYYNALIQLSSSAALTLLFQFVWMGVLLQSILERKPPQLLSVIAVLVILVGTVLAAGLLQPQGVHLTVLGVFFGIMAAVFYTAFLHFSGKAATELPTTVRTLFTNIGSLITAVCVLPLSVAGETAAKSLPWFGVPLALVGVILPVFLMQKAAPRIPDGVTTIMASSELPSGIFMAAMFLGDAVSALEWVGVVVVLGGIVLSQLQGLRTGKSPPSLRC